MPEQFGRYTLRERIGVGGMAEVFLARHVGVEGFEKDIVIKRIRPHLSDLPAFVTMFLAEAKLAAQLCHPNIVQIFDLGIIDGAYFIAMEYVAGRDLAAIIPKAACGGIPLPCEYIAKVGSCVCEGLYYAHAQCDEFGVPLEVVHRDLSPENIRVAWSGAVKILDFGIAKAASQLRQTKSGEIKGKVLYMSPEQVAGLELDQRSDIFALGTVLYECLTGVKLFAGDSDMAVMQNIVDGKIYPPSYFRGDIPETLEAVVMKALTRDRRKRYVNASDMQLDLDTFLRNADFMPSYRHLANFLKQLFSDELQKEEEKRSQSLAHPPVGALGPTQIGVPQLPESQTLQLHLAHSELHKLEALASRLQTTPEVIVHDLLVNHLKYT